MKKIINLSKKVLINIVQKIPKIMPKKEAKARAYCKTTVFGKVLKIIDDTPSPFLKYDSLK